MTAGERQQQTTLLDTSALPLASQVSRVALEVVAGPSVGARAETSGRRFAIGTHPSNDLVVTDPAVSRFHVRFEIGDDGVRVVDCGSTNGTVVNGVRIKSCYLPAPAQIQVGQTTIAAVPAAQPSEVDIEPGERFGDVIGRSVAMREVFATAKRIASTQVSVLILGETGTGKDVMARAIHQHSPRSDKPFVVCDCASIPAELIESALFGHVRGAFTGADRDHDGVFERATGGTLFLDEVGELPLALQPKLLRVLDGGEVTPVGGSQPRPIDVRVLAATNRDLRSMVEADQFRADLFYRLAVMSLELPPLRERDGDAALLAAHFAARMLGDGAMSAEQRAELERGFQNLSGYSWPGNVRELRNACERAVALSDFDLSQPGALGEALGGKVARGLRTRLPLLAAREQFDREYLRDLLASVGGDIKQAAEQAEIHPKSLERLLRKYAIPRP